MACPKWHVRSEVQNIMKNGCFERMLLLRMKMACFGVCSSAGRKLYMSMCRWDEQLQMVRLRCAPSCASMGLQCARGAAHARIAHAASCVARLLTPRAACARVFARRAAQNRVLAREQRKYASGGRASCAARLAPLGASGRVASGGGCLRRPCGAVALRAPRSALASLGASGLAACGGVCLRRPCRGLCACAHSLAALARGLRPRGRPAA